MADKLNTYVHVVERLEDGGQGRTGHFGPGDKLPDWAAEAITNPDVWDEGSPSVGSPVLSRREAQEEVGDRPRGNASRDAWAAYATAQGVEVTDYMDRGAIIAAVDSR